MAVVEQEHPPVQNPLKDKQAAAAAAAVAPPKKDDAPQEDENSSSPSKQDETPATTTTGTQQEQSPPPPLQESKQEEDDDEEEDEQWELTKVYPESEWKVRTCHMEDCSTPAFGHYQNVATTTNAAAEEETPTTYPYCLDCQVADFGGWPASNRELAVLPAWTFAQVQRLLQTCCVASSKSKKQKHEHAKTHHPAYKWPIPFAQGEETNEAGLLPSSETEEAEAPPPTTPAKEPEDVTEEVPEDEDDDEEWELVNVFSMDDLKQDERVMCSTPDCCTPAFGYYREKTKKTRFWYCLDCQAIDFGGWPTVQELQRNGISFLTSLHRQVLMKHCRNARKHKEHQDDVLAPPLDLPVDVGGSVVPLAATTTTSPMPGGPPPSFVTPPPLVVAPMKQQQQQQQVSKASLAIHQKWQATATQMGGGRLVVRKPQAKELILELLVEAFCPYTVTQIFQKLKGVVPSPVLSSCLKEMSCQEEEDFEMNFRDDEDDSKTSSKKTKAVTVPPLLKVKVGRTAGQNLYYVDYKMQRPPWLPHEKQEFLATAAQAQAELDALQVQVAQVKKTAATLQSQPTNEELTIQLMKLQGQVDELDQQVLAAKPLAAQTALRKQTKAKIVHMATHWRKRKRLCLDFFHAIEESSDGAISMRKCFQGDGQIDVESDEAVKKAELEMYQQKKKRAKLGGKGRGLVLGSKKATPAALALSDPSFVAVLLNSQGTVERVYAEE